MTVTLVYETHARTLDNERGRGTGWLPGELSAAGWENARELGLRRRDDGLSVVFCSDLARAVQTVEIAFAGSTIPVVLDRRLRECDYGSLNGAPVELVHSQRLDHVDVPFPAGQSYEDVVVGVQSLLAELVRDHDGERVVLVGHAATRFALDHLLAGRQLREAIDAPFEWQEGWTYRLER
ncbi:MAG TPA: histidine phosphatase family protein [Candidatus Limnocylindria bacterium]|nr:histidine phosphatase family protein [Candidatus Limnocylindria bacterium]